MASLRLNLIVLRSQEPMRAVNFYHLLGVRFQEEKHGNGPLHWAAEIGGLILEIYPVRELDESCLSLRLGFEVEDASGLLNSLRLSDVEVINDLKESPWGLRAVVRDPDGRAVELVQRVETPTME